MRKGSFTTKDKDSFELTASHVNSMYHDGTIFFSSDDEEAPIPSSEDDVDTGTYVNIDNYTSGETMIDRSVKRLVKIQTDSYGNMKDTGLVTKKPKSFMPPVIKESSLAENFEKWQSVIDDHRPFWRHRRIRHLHKEHQGERQSMIMLVCRKVHLKVRVKYWRSMNVLIQISHWLRHKNEDVESSLVGIDNGLMKSWTPVCARFYNLQMWSGDNSNEESLVITINYALENILFTYHIPSSHGSQ